MYVARRSNDIVILEDVKQISTTIAVGSTEAFKMRVPAPQLTRHTIACDKHES